MFIWAPNNVFASDIYLPEGDTEKVLENVDFMAMSYAKIKYKDKDYLIMLDNCNEDYSTCDLYLSTSSSGSINSTFEESSFSIGFTTSAISFNVLSTATFSFFHTIMWYY